MEKITSGCGWGAWPFLHRNEASPCSVITWEHWHKNVTLSERIYVLYVWILYVSGQNQHVMVVHLLTPHSTTKCLIMYVLLSMSWVAVRAIHVQKSFSTFLASENIRNTFRKSDGLKSWKEKTQTVCQTVFVVLVFSSATFLQFYRPKTYVWKRKCHTAVTWIGYSSYCCVALSFFWHLKTTNLNKVIKEAEQEQEDGPTSKSPGLCLCLLLWSCLTSITNTIFILLIPLITTFSSIWNIVPDTADGCPPWARFCSRSLPGKGDVSLPWLPNACSWWELLGLCK